MKTRFALFTSSGIVQHAPSINDMLATYNRHGDLYETRTTTEGIVQLWHKSQQRMIGDFRIVAEE